MVAIEAALRRLTWARMIFSWCGRMCKIRHMATNLSIDPDLLNKALEIGGERTKKATVNRALREFVARREQRKILDLFGRFDWDNEFDYKQERSR